MQKALVGGIVARVAAGEGIEREINRIDSLNAGPTGRLHDNASKLYFRLRSRKKVKRGNHVGRGLFIFHSPHTVRPNKLPCGYKLPYTDAYAIATYWRASNRLAESRIRIGRACALLTSTCCGCLRVADNSFRDFVDDFAYSLPPLHRRRVMSCQGLRARRGVGDRPLHSCPPFDGYDHRTEDKQCLSPRAAETFRPKTRKLLELRA